MKKTPRQSTKVPTKQNPPKSAGKVSEDNLTLDEIKELIELVSENQFNEFELERGSFRLRLQKGVKPASEPVLPVATAPAATVPKPVEETPAPAPVTSPAVAPASTQEEKLHVVTSPIVGTFYRAASPTALSTRKA